MQYEIAYTYGPPPGDHEGEDGGENEDKPRPYYATKGLLRLVHGRGDPRGRPIGINLSPSMTALPTT